MQELDFIDEKHALSPASEKGTGWNRRESWGRGLRRNRSGERAIARGKNPISLKKTAALPDAGTGSVSWAPTT